MAEARDTGIARPVVAAAVVGGTHHQLDSVAARVGERDELADFSALRFGGRAGVHRVSASLELYCGARELVRGSNLEGGRLIGGIALEIAQRVRALVGFEVEGVFGAFGDLEAEEIGGKDFGGFKVAGPEADVGDRLQIDHRALLQTQRNSGISLSLPQAQNESGAFANCRARCAARSAMRVPSATKLYST